MSISEDDAYLEWRDAVELARKRELVRRQLLEKIDAALEDPVLAMPEEQTPVDELLTGDHGRQSFMAGMDVREPPEFQEHECWRMLLIWPPDDGGPMSVKCSGCGAVGRIEWEYKP